MTAAEVRDHLARLGISQNAMSVHLFGVDPSTGRRWLMTGSSAKEIPYAVAIALTLLTLAKARALIEASKARGTVDRKSPAASNAAGADALN